MPRYDTVLLDADNTLFDFDAAEHAALRRALDRAWDRNTVAVALFSRHAQAAVLPVHPASPLYDQEADQRRGYSTQALGELLAQAGYAQDQEGRWARGGAPLELTFVVSTDNTFRLSAAEYLAGELGRAGITVDLQKLPWSDYVQALERGEFDRYDGIFLVLDRADRFAGETVDLPGGRCAQVRFRGSHREAPAQYPA